MKIFAFCSSVVLALVLLLTSLLGGVIETHTAAAASDCPLTYTILPLSLLTAHGSISDADAASPTDIWAVGYAWNDNILESQSLALHWNGTNWSAVPPSDGDSPPYMLFAVDAINSDDVWAVGEHGPALATDTLAKHWDGKAWTDVPTPNGAGEAGALNGVAGAVTDDVWAIGATRIGNVYQSLLLNWDGSDWNDVTSELPDATTGSLRRIVARSQAEVWILQDTNNSVSLLRWNGASWSVAAKYTPPIGVVGIRASDMLVFNENDVQISVNLDIQQSGEELRNARQILRWNGSTWNVDYTDAGKPRTFERMGAVGPDDLWAVGTIRRTLRQAQEKFAHLQDAAHWQGNAWHKENTIFYARGTDFADVIPISADEVWLFANDGAGQSSESSAFLPYIARGLPPCNGIPGQAVLKSPPDRAHIAPPGPRYNWNNVSGAYYYELTVNRDQPDGKEVLHQYLIKSSYTQTVELTGSKFYYWKVRACNNAGCGSWSDSRYFKYQ